MSRAPISLSQAAGGVRDMMRQAWLLVQSREAMWGMVDQGLSSSTNFLITLVVARQAVGASFGGFSLVITLYILSVWLSRSLSSDPFVVRFTTASPGEQRARAEAATVGAAVLVGVGCGMVTASVGVAAGSQVASTALVMAVALPLLLAQDAYRYLLIARRRARAAASNDALWFGLQLLLVACFVSSGASRPALFTGVFGAAGGIAAVFGGRQTGIKPDIRRSWAWLLAHRDLSLVLVAELVAVAGVLQLTILGIGLVANLDAVGELRAATLMFGPLTIVFMGGVSLGLPAAVRRRSRSEASFRSMVRVLGFGMPALAAVWTLVLLAVPHDLGTALLRSNWEPARNLLIPMGIVIGANATGLAAMIGLRALGTEATRRSLAARLRAAPAVVVGGLLGAHWAGALGAATGLAAASTFDSVVHWMSFRTSVRQTVGSRHGQA